MSMRNGHSSPADIKRLVRTVLAYHARYGRHTLLWRNTTDPYRILVSEIMLQQTQVDRVIPYYERFLKRFPTIHILAKAELKEVLVLWSGLGYNRRAKMLHEAAKEIVEKWGGGGGAPLPRAALESLRGIGSYTAGAIRAFAYNEPEVFIETNIRTVLIHELFPRSRKVSDGKLFPVLQEILGKPGFPKGGAREWYAALMDYGSFLKSTYPNPSRKSRHHAKQSKFEGSLRQVRGAILKAVIQRKTLTEVRKRFPKFFAQAHAALVKEGMIGA